MTPTDPIKDLDNLVSTYLEFCKSTYPLDHTREQIISHCVLGMVGEFLEWVNAETGSREELLEAGDVFYYATILGDVLGIDLATLYWEIDSNRRGSLTDLLTLTESTKKYLYYSPPKYTTSEYTMIVREAVLVLLGLVTGVWLVPEILEANTDKLTQRYHTPEVT
jgi:hypothetical protein